MDRLSNAALERGPARPGPRLAWIDAARGAAVVAMVVYHSAWDLSELRLVAPVVIADPGWRFFARAIASSFLVLVGIGLVLAHGERVRLRPLLRRVGIIAAAALVVTVATWFAFPESYIFFGILHQIAAASLLTLPFVRGPALGAATAAVLVWIAPLVLTQPIFDAPALGFLGLGTRLPDTNDWVPIFPWTGFVLAGIAAATLLRLWPRSGAVKSGGAALGPLAWLGRHSLAIYVLHQPLIFGALWCVASLVGPLPSVEAQRYERMFVANCERGGRNEDRCRMIFRCTDEALRRNGLWDPIVTRRFTAEDVGRIGPLAQACFDDVR